MNKQSVNPIIFDSYMAMIKNSVGTKMFRSFFAYVDGQRVDVMNDGDLSCAYYTSCILTIFNLLKHRHATVASTKNDLIDSGWKEADEVLPGAVLVWEEKVTDDKSVHQHIGFYIGDNQAISNGKTSRVPEIHHWTYDGQRKITSIYYHHKLKNG